MRGIAWSISSHPGRKDFRDMEWHFIYVHVMLEIGRQIPMSKPYAIPHSFATTRDNASEICAIFRFPRVPSVSISISSVKILPNLSCCLRNIPANSVSAFATKHMNPNPLTPKLSLWDYEQATAFRIINQDPKMEVWCDIFTESITQSIRHDCWVY